MMDTRPPKSRSAIALWLLAGTLAVAVGCTTVGVRKASLPDLTDDGWAGAVRAGTPSPRTWLALRRYDLDPLYRRDPAEAVARLHAEALLDPRPESLFALAELTYLRGRYAEEHGQPCAVDDFYRSAGYAYHFLLGPGDDSTPAVRSDPFDPHFRQACALYNAGVAKCLRAAQKAGRLDPRSRLSLTGDGAGAAVEHVGFLWKPEEFGELRFCADFRVEGLDASYRTYGLGVPLIATRATGAPARRYVPPNVSFPATAFLRFEGGLADLPSPHQGRLELVNPLAVRTLAVRGRKVPLETDLTTPLAYYLQGAGLEGAELTGFLRPDRLAGRTGIHMLEPYQPGKIPVLLVHGLLSSPLTWAPLFNDLQADPELRQRYQFWAYFYPTGTPYLDTAADLRQSLERLRTDLDPEGRDPALGEMVLVGHSMGGLISKLMTVDSGDDFWKKSSPAALDELKLPPGEQEAVRRVFFFEHEPVVKRVVFLGTPHHGSNLSPALPGKIARRLVKLPVSLMQVAKDAAAGNPHFLDGGRLPTSVDLLSPDSPALSWLAERSPPEGVRYHSVIGVAPPGSTVLERFVAGDFSGEPGDGVVSYKSAHLDGTESEVVVPADHFHVHQHPLAVLEVRRILREHADSVGSGGRKGQLQLTGN
jgi:pimeloyl-ACP methyl ester carboxylesterase